VIGLPDDRWGQTVVAAVRTVPGQTIDAGELFALCRQRLAAHKAPRTWYEIEEFPRTASGRSRRSSSRSWRGDGKRTGRAHPDLNTPGVAIPTYPSPWGAA